MPRKLLTILLTAALLLTGCLGASDDASPAQASATGPATPGGAAAAGPAVNDTANVTDKDHMPHVHDYWFGKEKVTIFDEEVEMNALGTFANVLFAGENAVGGAFFRLPEGTIVYEGTGEVEVAATWTDATVRGLKLFYKSAADEDLRPEPLDLASGEPVTIPLTADMTDMPHSRVSKWAFYLAGAGTPPVAVGSARVTITLHKVHDVMEFPPHPNPWAEASVIEVMDADGTTDNDNLAVQLTRFFTGDLHAPGAKPPTGSVVPMGTRALLANLTVKSTQAGPAQEVASVALYYRTAAQWRYERAELVHEDGDAYQFRIPVAPGHEDGPYAEESMWRFYPVARTEVAGQESPCSGCTDYKMDYHLTVTAYPVENP